MPSDADLLNVTFSLEVSSMTLPLNDRTRADLTRRLKGAVALAVNDWVEDNYKNKEVLIQFLGVKVNDG